MPKNWKNRLFSILHTVSAAYFSRMPIAAAYLLVSACMRMFTLIHETYKRF